MASAANVTKYNAGGSGDNVIADGYINTVEKVWIDSYTIDFTNTNTTIDIAVLQPNKKITGIAVLINTTASQTNGTVSLGFSTDSAVNTLLVATTITHNLTRSAIVLPSGNILGTAVAALGQLDNFVTAGWQLVTGGTQTTVSLKLNNWTMTTGTIKTIVRWT